VSQEIDIVVLDASGVTAAANDLGRVLADCVAGGASVSFMHPFPPDDAAAYFRKLADEVARGDVIVLAARRRGTIVGTVQLMIATPPNQPHRADIAKLLVRRSARRHGVAARLMEAAEREARAEGRTLLVLDTVTGDAAERLYARLGWTRVGVIPGYALYPDGRFCDTTAFYKQL
jgi:GNAT superfamily N-acetyltransferase